MDKSNKHDVVVAAIDAVKAGTFHATAIKVELEAQLHRESYSCDEWEDEMICQDYILGLLEPLGLAVENTGDGRNELYNKWRPNGALKYAQFYNDGSVDSELTFTLSLENSKDILKLPDIVEAWNKFMGMVVDDVEESAEIDGSGMHMAWINDPTCNYNSHDRPNSKRMAQFKNFRKSMQLLLPAMYFLASADDTARGLDYRKPQVECGDEDSTRRARSFYDRFKYSAISYRNCALEFRAFDVCYNKPEQILDNVVVMKNCLRYWRNNFKSSGLERIAKRITFGNDSSQKLERFYCTTQHIDLLNAGLRKLKPSYISIKQAKEQRGFKTSKRTIVGAIKQLSKDAVQEYQEYEERFQWDLLVRRSHVESRIIEDMAYKARGTTEKIDEDAILKSVKPLVEKDIEERKKRKVQLNDFVKDKISRHNENQRGHYTLTA